MMRVPIRESAETYSRPAELLRPFTRAMEPPASQSDLQDRNPPERVHDARGGSRRPRVSTLHKVFTESLILAQDERWRRA